MIRITSRNGYTGVLSGESTLAIYDSRGNEVMHTGSRTINSEKELRRFVNGFPKHVKQLLAIIDDLKDEDTDDGI